MHMREQTSAMNLTFHFLMDTSGMIEVRSISLYMFFFSFLSCFYIYIYFILDDTETYKNVYVDIGPSRLAGASPIERQRAVRDMVVRNVEVDEELQEIKDNLQWLTVGIPNISIVLSF